MNRNASSFGDFLRTHGDVNPGRPLNADAAQPPPAGQMNVKNSMIADVPGNIFLPLDTTLNSSFR